MSGQSSIQWTDATWNPTVGCTRVSAGCGHCYAFDMHDRRFYAPYIKAKRAGREIKVAPQFHQPFSRMQLLPERLDDPLHWRKPRRVFVNSMSDLFHPDVPDRFIAQVFAVMSEARRHTFQILTKRPERMARLLTEWYTPQAGGPPGPLPNVWLGVSVGDQAAADERIPLLLQTPATVRFISAEPLLGPIDRLYRFPDLFYTADVRPSDDALTRGIDWVIIGGESGPHAREMELEWAFSLKDQCEAAGVPVFVKQLGSVYAKRYGWRDRHGGNPAEWPHPLLATLYRRQWPGTTQMQTQMQTQTVAAEARL